jgi:hypothetical protein
MSPELADSLACCLSALTVLAFAFLFFEICSNLIYYPILVYAVSKMLVREH